MVCRYGVAIMTQRTTFALDRDTMKRLKRLSSKWHVSQAEVVRRAIADAEKRPEEEAPDPVAMLNELHAAGRGLVREKAESYLAEVSADRATWRGK
jgi:predicted transcriptional regulator